MNTKRYLRKILIVTIFSSSLYSCDYLDKEPFDLITPEKVWDDPKLINAVLVNLYDQMQVEDFDYWGFDENYLNRNLATMSDEATGGYQKSPAFDNPNDTYTYEETLFGTFAEPYKGIRSCNDFIRQLKTASLDEVEKEQLTAEVRFIRAWHYFSLVKRYGGVPLIIESQDYAGPSDLEKLQLPRSTEETVYNFIINECKQIAPILPLANDASGQYRANRGAAWALCSRAALYAGSIAKYGTVQLDGVVGIVADKANSFFQIAFDASNEVFALNIYSLYNQKIDDPVTNFYELFQKENRDNSEYIFQKAFDAEGGKGSDFDKMNAPFSMTQGGWGCATSPSLELVEAFEYIDGTKGTLKLTNDDGTPRRFDNLIDIFTDKDPRLFASVLLPGMETKGSYMEWRRGIIKADGEKLAAAKDPNGKETYTDPTTGQIYNVSGKDGGGDVGDASKTGFYQRKFWDESLENVDFGKSDNSWPIFRLAEIYLNKAEAAIELGGKDNDALSAVNEIRGRAGIKRLSSINLEQVRNERRVELAFEGHRFWDLRRWRLAHQNVTQGGLTGYRATALYPWLDTRDGKYIFTRGEKIPKQERLFLERNYYIKIEAEDLNSNPKMVQNPGYTN